MAKVSKAVGKPAPITYNNEIVGYGCSDLYVSTISSWLARTVIMRFHYSKSVVNNSYLHLGIYAGRDLVGVMQWGYALQPSSGSRVVLGTSNRDYMELNRLWVHNCMPKNTESRVISYGLKLIKLLHPSVQWVQTFADERCKRGGVVYQASNFLYIGSHESEFYELDGLFYHSLAANRKNGGSKSEFLQRNIKRAKKLKYRQFRYIRFLNKKAKKRLNTKLFQIQPYPKVEH